MSIFDRLASDKAEASIAQVVFGGLVVSSVFVITGFAGLSSNFDLTNTGNKPVAYEQQTNEDTEPFDNINETTTEQSNETDDEPMGDTEEWTEDTENTDGSDDQPPAEEESSAMLVDISNPVSCSGDLNESGSSINDFSITLDTYLPVGSTISMPVWIHDNEGVYNQSSGYDYENPTKDGENYIFKVSDEGEEFTYVYYYQSTSIEDVDINFNETFVFTLPEGYEPDADSSLVVELNKDSASCEFDTI